MNVRGVLNNRRPGPPSWHHPEHLSLSHFPPQPRCAPQAGMGGGLLVTWALEAEMLRDSLERYTHTPSRSGKNETEQASKVKGRTGTQYLPSACQARNRACSRARKLTDTIDSVTSGPAVDKLGVTGHWKSGKNSGALHTCAHTYTCTDMYTWPHTCAHTSIQTHAPTHARKHRRAAVLLQELSEEHGALEEALGPQHILHSRVIPSLRALGPGCRGVMPSDTPSRAVSAAPHPLPLLSTHSAS